jgi:hypothetical protein
MENVIRALGLAIAKCVRVMEKNDSRYFPKIALGVKVLELAQYVKVPDSIRNRELVLQLKNNTLFIRITLVGDFQMMP